MPSSNNVRKVTSENYPTDAGREGELIFRLVYQQAGCKKPFSRLWISSMEDSAIQKGFANLKPSTEYDSLYNAALCRERADWMVGIACIATAFAEYRKHGERIYTDALRVLAEAWEGDIDSLRAEVLQGVTQFVALYDHEYDHIRLIRQLQRTSPVAIYRSGQAMTGPNYQKYMLQILKAYNGSSRTKSLPIKQ